MRAIVVGTETIGTAVKLVRRLQRRVHARQSRVLLPADHHRLREPLSLDVRSALDDARDLCLHRLERTFQEFGLPHAIRTDNGLPFSFPNALHGLSRLSVWWLRLGIRLERIKPGHPEQNGRHERMHLTLKTEATKPAAHNDLQQQARFDAFLHRYNQERPHQALDMKMPGELCAASAGRGADACNQTL